MQTTINPSPLPGLTGEGLTDALSLIGLGMIFAVLILIIKYASPRSSDTQTGKKKLVFKCRHCPGWHSTYDWFEPRD